MSKFMYSSFSLQVYIYISSFFSFGNSLRSSFEYNHKLSFFKHLAHLKPTTKTFFRLGTCKFQLPENTSFCCLPVRTAAFPYASSEMQGIYPLIYISVGYFSFIVFFIIRLKKKKQHHSNCIKYSKCLSL